MILLQQAGAATILLRFTLSLQCGGAAALILWIRSIPRETQRVRVFHCASLVMQTTVAVIVLHGIVILLWASSFTAMFDQDAARSSQSPSDEVRATWSGTAWGELGFKCSAPLPHRRALRAHMNFLESASNLPKHRSGIFVLTHN